MKSLSLINFKNSYKTIQYSIFSLNILAIILFLYSTYNYLDNKKFLNFFSSLESIEKNTKSIFLYMLPMVFNFLHLFLFLLVLWLVNWGIKNIFIPNSWIIRWVEEEKINNIFGRFLAEHFRWYKTIKVKDFIYYENISHHQIKMLNYHHKMKILFKKYDLFFEKDIEK